MVMIIMLLMTVANGMMKNDINNDGNDGIYYKTHCYAISATAANDNI